MAAKQKVTHVKTRVRKSGKANKAGYRACNVCHGTGVVKNTGRKK